MEETSSLSHVESPSCYSSASTLFLSCVTGGMRLCERAGNTPRSDVSSAYVSVCASHCFKGRCNVSRECVQTAACDAVQWRRWSAHGRLITRNILHFSEYFSHLSFFTKHKINPTLTEGHGTFIKAGVPTADTWWGLDYNLLQRKCQMFSGFIEMWQKWTFTLKYDLI